MTTLMRPYLELEKSVAEALGWKEVSIVEPPATGGFSGKLYDQTVLTGEPPDYNRIVRVPRYIRDGQIRDLIDEFEINVLWYNNSVSAQDSYERIFAEINEKFCDHPNKRIALYTALCKMVVAIKNYVPKEK